MCEVRELFQDRRAKRLPSFGFESSSVGLREFIKYCVKITVRLWNMLSTPSPQKNKLKIKKVENDRRPIIIASTMKDKEPEIELGGVFLDYATRTAEAEAKSRDLEAQVTKLEHENRELKIEIENLKSQWKATAEECMSQGSANAELSEVLQHLQLTKNEVENEVASLKLTICELEAANHVLEEYKAKTESRLKSNEMNRIQLEHIISVEKEENSTLTGVIYSKDEEIAEKRDQLAKSKNEVEVLKKSIATKDKQLATLVKDRDRNRDALAQAKKAMLPKQREILHRSIGENGDSSLSPSVSSVRRGAENNSNARDMDSSRSAINSTVSDISNGRAALDDFDSYLPRAIGGSADSNFDSGFNKKERQYLSTIKRLKSEIEKLRKDNKNK